MKRFFVAPLDYFEYVLKPLLFFFLQSFCLTVSVFLGEFYQATPQPQMKPTE